jgi:hypothetical protein
MSGNAGTEQYHSFKTKLANASSMQSIHDITGYCSTAKEIFAIALDSAKTSLAAFVSTQKTEADDQFSACQVQTAGLAAASAPPQDVPLPRLKPVSAN